MRAVNLRFMRVGSREGLGSSISFCLLDYLLCGIVYILRSVRDSWHPLVGFINRARHISCFLSRSGMCAL
jgi:hypothetical protein